MRTMNKTSQMNTLANPPIVICLVGITGEGKSTTGNTISGDRNAFKASARSKSVTSTCAFVDFECNHVNYRVIDTPGLQDTNLTPEELYERFKQFADLAPQGVDSFLFVCKRGRFKPEHVQAFHTFQEACTSEALQHTAFLFTNLDEETNSDFQRALREEACEVPNLVDCLRKVNGRVIGIDNKGGTERAETDRRLAIDLVQQIRSINLGRRYSNAQLQEAEMWRREVESQALKLESFDNRETMKAELAELLHGRRDRAQVEAKLIELYKGETEARRILEEKEAARKAKERAEEQVRLMQAQAEAARKAKEEAAALEEKRRAEAAAKRAMYEKKSSKELIGRSEQRKLLLQKLQGEPVDITAAAQDFNLLEDMSVREETFAPPKKRIEQSKKVVVEEQWKPSKPEIKRSNSWKTLDEDAAKAKQKQIHEDEAKKAGEENLLWLMSEISKERAQKQQPQEKTKKAVDVKREISSPALLQQRRGIEPIVVVTAEQQKHWERSSVASTRSQDTVESTLRSSGSSSGYPSRTTQFDLGSFKSDRLSDVERYGSPMSSPKEKINVAPMANFTPLVDLSPLDNLRNGRGLSPRKLRASEDYKTPLYSSLRTPELRTPEQKHRSVQLPVRRQRSLLSTTERSGLFGSKEKRSLLSPDLAELLAKIANKGGVGEQTEMGA